MQDLVPCVLLSFECEHILVWRGRDWKSTMEPIQDLKGLQEVGADLASGLLASSPSTSDPSLSFIEAKSNVLETSLSPTYSNEEPLGNSELPNDGPVVASHAFLTGKSIDESEESPVSPGSYGNNSEASDQMVASELVLEGLVESSTPENTECSATSHEQLVSTKSGDEQMNPSLPFSEETMLLRQQAIDSGMAFALDDNSLDADTVFKMAMAFAKTAPAGPVFRPRPKKSAVQKNEEQDSEDSRPEEAPAVLGAEMTVYSSRRDEKKPSRNGKMKDIKADYLNVVPHGNLRVDELAKLLA